MKTVRSVQKLPSRRPDSHKGDFGHVAVIAGSRGMTGAAALASMAALRTGAGLVTLGIPESLNAIMEVKLTEVMTRPLKETTDGTLAGAAFDGVTDMLAMADVLAIGPGLSMNRQTAALARKIVKSCDLPMVIDADAINALSADPNRKKIRFGRRAVLTPHPAEFARIAGISKTTIADDRRETAGAFARKHHAVVVLKGHGTVVTDGDRAYTNSSGNPGMATAGAGDVLTGIIAACLSQGMEPMSAAVTGAYLHGLAGDMAARSVGQHCVIATDILDAIPDAIGRHMRR